MKNPKNRQIINKLNPHAKKKDTYLITRWQEKKSKQVEAVDSAIENVSTKRLSGIGLHLFDREGHSVLTSTDNLQNSEHLKEVLGRGVQSLKNINKQATTTQEVFLLKPEKDKINLTADFDFKLLTTKEIEKKLLNLNKKIKDVGKALGIIKNIKISSRFHIFQERWQITRSDGTDVQWEYPRSYLGIRLIYKKGQIKVGDSITRSSPGWQLLTKGNLQKGLMDEAQFVLKLLKESAERPEYPAGSYPLLIDANLGGLLAHEAFGHCAESDIVHEGGSVLSKNGKFQKGKKVASSIVSIIDKTREKTWSYQPYSAFGVPREDIKIVEKGTLKESLSDVLTGRDIGDEIRGSSRVQSYTNTPIPRMACTYISVEDPEPSLGFLTGPQKIQEALKNKGLLKEKVLVLRNSRGGGQVDTQAGTFMFGFSYLYEITPDSINLFRGSSFSGKTLEALKAIKKGFGPIKTDFPGMCGKGQRVTNLNGANEFIYLEDSPYVTLGGS